MGATHPGPGGSGWPRPRAVRLATCLDHRQSAAPAGPTPVHADAATATFAVLWRRIADAPADPLPWLYGVARRELANRRRAQSRFGAFLARLSNDRIVTGAEVAADASTQAVDRSSARIALGRLRPDDRELLMLIGWEGLSPSDAAASLGVSIPTFSVRLHRARQRLESELAAFNKEEHE